LRTSDRPPQPGDLRFIEETENICFPDPWPGHFFASEIIAPGRFHRLLIEPAGKIVAFLFSTWQYLDLHVLKIATLPEYRRAGMARKLMGMAEAHVVEMGGESVTLEVRVTNGRARGLYRSMGYSEAGRRPGYYPDGEEGIVMTKWFSA